jgi:hypothetical protein
MIGLILALSFAVFLNDVPQGHEMLFFASLFFNITERDVNIFFHACQALFVLFFCSFRSFLKKAPATEFALQINDLRGFVLMFYCF